MNKPNTSILKVLIILFAGFAFPATQSFAQDTESDEPGTETAQTTEESSTTEEQEVEDTEEQEEESTEDQEVSESSPLLNKGQIIRNGKLNFKGNLFTKQHIYYEGDSLEISVKFTRGSNELAESDADAHIVIINHEGNITSVPVDDDIGNARKKFFRIQNVSTETLPEGQYQLALVLTVAGGDPANLADWYSGFRGLLDVEAIYISASALPGDDDLDGEWDNDSDGDGIENEEEDESDDEDETESETETAS